MKTDRLTSLDSFYIFKGLLWQTSFSTPLHPAVALPSLSKITGEPHTSTYYGHQFSRPPKDTRATYLNSSSQTGRKKNTAKILWADYYIQNSTVYLLDLSELQIF